MTGFESGRRDISPGVLRPAVPWPTQFAYISRLPKSAINPSSNFARASSVISNLSFSSMMDFTLTYEGSGRCGGATKAKAERSTLHIKLMMLNWYAKILVGDNDTSSQPPND